MISLDIFSDPICPWCHIGKARLDVAIAETGRDLFAIRWRMFRLNPDMPPEGMDRRAYLAAKFGGPEGAARVYAPIAEAAEASGLSIAFDRIARTPQTLDAHRLLHWARGTGSQHAVAGALFRAYFEEGRDISDHAVLAEIAAAEGMDAPVVARLLEGDADRAALEEEEAAARAMGVNGVPCFVVDGRYVLSGAQERATWVGVIGELARALAASGAGEAGEAGR